MNMARHHIAFQAGRRNTYMSSINLTDEASAIVAALACPAGTYNIVDDAPVTQRQDTQAMSEAVGSKARVAGQGSLR
jgi:NAD dependent epimerase/dehydratase family enzyme